MSGVKSVIGPRGHTHKYMWVSLKYQKVWRCADCNHFMPAHLSELVIGRMSLCWDCGSVFKLGESNKDEEFPICTQCSLEKQGIDLTQLIASL